MKADENPVIVNIKTRRSVREYLDTPLSEETIKKIIDAGRYAPTGLNLQPWHFIVVQNKGMLKKLSEYAKPILAKNLEGRNDAAAINFMKRLQDKNFNLFYNAPVLILVIGSKNNALTDYDCSLCAGNMMLAAHSMGIGSCWIGGAAVIQQSAELMAELKIPPDYKLVAPVIFGYQKTIPPIPEKREPVVFWMR
ncbi:MAG: nitroreductase [Candidatus Methanoperedens sp.]|nr:nitroreductase [Candidatus Methanoperedens sp.]MCZ7396039.1 nitroreductase [Candidatus Methanoperedens sp.]